MEISEILKKVRKIEIKTKHISNDLFMGDYNTVFKGRGMSFSEVREYSYGDNIRHIDWNVTARTNYPHVKVFEEEREMTMMFLIDCSQSAIWGTSESLKNEYITELFAVLAYSAINNNDKVGALLFNEGIEHYIPPAKGRKQILRILREIIGLDKPAAGTDVANALKYFHSIHKKKTTCFLISDFLDNDYKNAFNIVAKKHDLICMHVFDKGEYELPNVGLVRVKDLESDAYRILNTSSSKVRQNYLEHYKKYEKELIDTCNKTKVDLLQLQTDQDYVKNLLSFFKRRKRS